MSLLPPRPRMTGPDWVLTGISAAIEATAIWYLCWYRMWRKMGRRG